MAKPLKVLIVEDSKDDAELLLRELQNGGFEPEWERVETEEAMEGALAKKKWDLVIADYRLPKFSAPKALEVLKKTGIDLPFIIVSGTVEEDAIVLSLKAGARDFFRKDRLKLLPAAVERELKEAVERRERRLAEEVLRKNEVRYRTIIENLYDIIYSCTENGTITFVTPNISVLGYSVEDVVGRQIFDFIHPDDLESMKKDFELAVGSGEVFPSVCRLKKKGGEYIYIEEIGKVVMNEDEPAGINGVIRDVTDRMRSEVELKKSQEELSEWSRMLEERVQKRTSELEKAQQMLVEQGRLALLGQVAASLSHELRTPLTGIKNSVYLMRMLGVEKHNPKIAENIALINMEIDACVRVLNNMLDFVRPKAPITKESRLEVIINNTLASIMIPQNIKVSKEIPSTLPHLMIDAMEIHQAFDNIIKNAIEAMNMGGELTVAARVEGNYIVVEFSDTGAGIAHENLHKIFDPLFSTSPTGVGLGLTIARQLIEAHGGTIEARSESEKGSTFTVRLPVN